MAIKLLETIRIERWLAKTLISVFFCAVLVKIRGIFTEKYNILFIYLYIYINNGIFAPLFMNFTLNNI